MPYLNDQSIRNRRAFKCPRDGYHKDPKSCSSFYRCINNMPYQMECAGGNVYDPALKGCTYASSSTRLACRTGTLKKVSSSSSSKGGHNFRDMYNQYIYLNHAKQSGQ
ncbi:uncharacterized protein LOC142322702 isoform X2 [Lycorma delicatula]|uniref:uncharacterized protein LOC142322702 isoform X2 n=1 Tax=Lycorma delicatula TaxID=130591 RepID=UPI003F51896F